MADDLEGRLEGTSVATTSDSRSVEIQQPLSHYLDKLSGVLSVLEPKSRRKVEALLVYRLYLEQNVSNPDLVLKTLAKISGKKESTIRYGPRFSSLVPLRKIGYHAIRALGVSSNNTGKYFFGKDHSTVLTSQRDVDLDIIKFKKLVDAAFSETDLSEEEIQNLRFEYTEIESIPRIATHASINRNLELILGKLDSETAERNVRDDALIRGLVTYSLLLEQEGINFRNLKAAVLKIGSFLYGRTVLIRDIDGKKRWPHISALRYIICHAYRKSGLSYPKIGNLVNKNHATVMTACEKIDEALEEHNDTASRILDGTEKSLTETKADFTRKSDDKNLERRVLSPETDIKINVDVCYQRVWLVLQGMDSRERELVRSLIVYRALLEEGGVYASNVLKKMCERLPSEVKQDLKPKDLLTDNKDSFSVANRSVAYYIYKQLGLSYPKIAVITKRKEHSQIVSAVQKVGNALIYYKALIDAACSGKPLTTEEHKALDSKYWKQKAPVKTGTAEYAKRSAEICKRLLSDATLTEETLADVVLREFGVTQDEFDSRSNKAGPARIALCYLKAERFGRGFGDIRTQLGYRNEESAVSAYLVMSNRLRLLKD